MPNKSLECWDVETLRNYFSVTFVDIKDTSKVYIYVICPWRNDYLAMLKHLKTVKGLVGYNNVGFDYPVLHPFIAHPEIYSKIDGAELVKLIYKRANKVIKEDWKRDFGWDEYLIDQLDLFRINHFNNRARFTSLKFLQINMDWHDVREMNHSHSAIVKQGAEEANILEYNLNDVLSTIEFYNRCADKIKLRTSLSKKYGVNMRNFNDGQIGSRLFMKKMASMTGKSEKELSSRRTHRKYIELKDCIVEGGVEFEFDGFRGVFEKFMDMTVVNTRKEEDISVYYDGMVYHFGFGGLHASRDPGVYRDITSADVSSYYPNLSIGQRFYPQHLGEYFCDAYEEIYKERSTFKKGTAENLAFKYALNIPFGQSNADWSPFYDPAYLLKITINGQLLLAQLCEWITSANAGRIIMANTDGVEVDVYDQDKFKAICSRWEEKHTLKLEYGGYKVLALRDSNAYIGQKLDGTTKEKGPYLLSENREIHQNQSMKIVQEAVKEYFINNIPIEKTVNDCQDIRMFLIGKRARTGKLEYRKAETTELQVQQLPKNLRYYISRSGGSIVKVLKDSTKKKKMAVGANQMGLFGNMGEKEKDQFRYVSLHKGWRMTLFNTWVKKPFEEYVIEKRYYMNEATKLINAIINSQTSIK